MFVCCCCATGTIINRHLLVKKFLAFGLQSSLVSCFISHNEALLFYLLAFIGPSSRISYSIWRNHTVFNNLQKHQLRYFKTSSTVFAVTAGVYKNESNFKMHSEKAVVEFPNLKIIVIPATADNFMYLVRASYPCTINLNY